jgi:hypothetical protein
MYVALRDVKTGKIMKEQVSTIDEYRRWMLYPATKYVAIYVQTDKKRIWLVK